MNLLLFLESILSMDIPSTGPTSLRSNYTDETSETGDDTGLLPTDEAGLGSTSSSCMSTPTHQAAAMGSPLVQQRQKKAER